MFISSATRRVTKECWLPQSSSKRMGIVEGEADGEARMACAVPKTCWDSGQVASKRVEAQTTPWGGGFGLEEEGSSEGLASLGLWMRLWCLLPQKRHVLFERHSFALWPGLKQLRQHFPDCTNVRRRERDQLRNLPQTNSGCDPLHAAHACEVCKNPSGALGLEGKRGGLAEGRDD